jgi:hypothetical protein
MEKDPSRQRFAVVHHADGSVVISDDGIAATLLRGDRASSFLAEVASDGLQAVAARWTTRYRPGVVFVGRGYARRPVQRPEI